MRIISALLFLLVSGCATSNAPIEAVSHAKPETTLTQKEKWDFMVGKWLGEQPTKEGGNKQWIVERHENGTYKISFRVYKRDGQYSESAEVGHWGISGPVYFSSFRGHIIDGKISPVDPSDPYNYDAYEIIQLDNNIFKYKHYETGNVYAVKKVGDDFQFLE